MNPIGEHNPTPSRLRVGLTLLAIFAAYVLLASSSSLWDRDEPRFARATVEMVQSGDYLVPTFNGELRPDKPAGIYWAMSVGYRALHPLGLTELGVRLPSLLGMTLAAFLTFLVGRRLFNARVGYRAMVFYGSAIMAAYMATASTSDGTMNGLITLAIWCFVEIAYGGKRLPLLILMTIALAGAQLVKGPVGVVVPLISMLTMGVLGARAGAFKLERSAWAGIGLAVIVSFGAFAAWGIPANLSSDGELLRQGLGKHVVQRSTSAMENHGGSGILEYLAWLPFYIPILIATFMPWTMHLPGGLSAMFRKTLGNPKQRAVLWGWILPTFILMTLVVTRLPHYILPIFPGLAVLCAAVIDQAQEEKLDERDQRWLRLGRFFSAPCLLGAAGAAVAVAVLGFTQDQASGLAIPGILLAAALIGFGTMQVIHLRKGQHRQAARYAVISLPVVLVIACFGILPTVEHAIKPSRELAQKVKALGLPDDAPVLMTGFNEASLVFYLDRPVDKPVLIEGDLAKIAQWARQDEPGLMIIRAQTLERLEAKQGKIDLESVFTRTTIQYSSASKPLELIALKRGEWDKGK